MDFVIFQIRMDSTLKNDLLLSLAARGRSLVLPQLDIPGFVDSPWEAYPFWGVDGGLGGGEQEEEREEELWLVCKMKNELLK